MATKLRSLTSASMQAALQAHRQATLEEVQHIPTAEGGTKHYRLQLNCQYTGLLCGTLQVPTVAGYLPYLGQWKQQQVLHPLFTLDFIPLLKFSKNTWIRFCGFSQEESENAALTHKQEQMLQVACLAMLHQLTEVRQEVQWLPDFVAVQNNWQSIIQLCYWKAYLDSKRFTFPTLRISKREPTVALNSFLATCWEAKKDYERSVNAAIDEAKAEAAEGALLAIRNELAGKTPLSNKMLWRWFVANLSKRYNKDAAPDGWMQELFTAKGTNIFDFTVADIDLFEEIFLCECPLGSSVSHAFLQVLNSKRKMIESHFEAFEILIPDTLQAQADSGEIAAAEPLVTDFAKRTAWMIAHAKWRLTHGTASGVTTKHREDAKARQSVVTVKASFVPKLNIGGHEEVELEATDLEDAGIEVDVDSEQDQGE